MDSGAEENSGEPSRGVTGWTMALICVAIVAAGVLVGGLLHEREPESTTAPVTTSSTPAPRRMPSRVTPTVAFPVAIPGCATVEPPTEGRLSSFLYTDDANYDNPVYPWFSGPKAVAMSQAALAALPREIEIVFASIEHSLSFRPILDLPAASEAPPGFGGWTNADADVRRGDTAGNLGIAVRRSAEPVPPCVAGDLDERRHLPEGIVDVDETWYETDGVRTSSRSARAYLTDGTAVTASVSDTGSKPARTSDTVPMSLDELVALVTAPGLRVGAPVPPGTPNAPEVCTVHMTDGGRIDAATARRLNAVLAQAPLDGLTLDRPLGDLRPPDFSGLGVCQAVRITTPGRESRLKIAIRTEQAPPDDAASTGEERVTLRRLPDGTVVETRESNLTSMGAGVSASVVEHVVTVTRPSGTAVSIRSSAEKPVAPLAFEQLEAIATLPGLEVR